MRQILIVVFMCAASASAATASPTSRYLAKRSATAQAANRVGHLREHHGARGGGGLGGIHPLVGSGDY